MLRGKALPALLATGRAMGASSFTFAAIGGVFAAVDVRARALEGQLSPKLQRPPADASHQP